MRKPRALTATQEAALNLIVERMPHHAERADLISDEILGHVKVNLRPNVTNRVLRGIRKYLINSGEGEYPLSERGIALLYDAPEEDEREAQDEREADARARGLNDEEEVQKMLAQQEWERIHPPFTLDD